MQPTGEFQHWRLPDGGVMKLSVLASSAGAEFVWFDAAYVRLDDVPHPKLHRAVFVQRQPKVPAVVRQTQGPQCSNTTHLALAKTKADRCPDCRKEIFRQPDNKCRKHCVYLCRECQK